jgi:hypothetical protein
VTTVVRSVLELGSDYYLVPGTAKSYHQASAEILRIDEMIGEEINGETDD